MGFITDGKVPGKDLRLEAQLVSASFGLGSLTTAMNATNANLTAAGVSNSLNGLSSGRMC